MKPFPRGPWTALVAGMSAGHAVLIALFWWANDCMMLVSMVLGLAGLLLSLREQRRQRTCAAANAPHGPTTP